MPALPDPNRPNNEVGGFWSDLDPTHSTTSPAAPGSGVYTGILSDGTNNYLFVDYENVVLFGTTTPQTFETVIQLGATEHIWNEYGHVSDNNNTTGVIIGAENRDGTSGVDQYYNPGIDVSGGTTTGSVPADGSEYEVLLSGPTAGGSVSIDYDATALKPGTYTETANLTSDVTPGVTQVTTQLTATKAPSHGHGHGH